MKYYNVYNYKFCTLGIAEEEAAVSNIFFNGNIPPDGFEKKETPLIKNAAEQLTEYFCGKRQAFDLPFSFHGTTFTVNVWKKLLTIPYGETRSYGEIAAMIGSPKACRAVGMANHNNQIAIIVPCHRVIGHNGSLTGYAGGLELKQKLLELEHKYKHAH
ncbi:MAG: methylated-DNA--[protein]-cysteine S-methyltransferase [Treponema sp.]|nr:methylated-DNA--[protein]-cysteine S-methyltransferase [Treponema sp.]